MLFLGLVPLRSVPVRTSLLLPIDTYSVRLKGVPEACHKEAKRLHFFRLKHMHYYYSLYIFQTYKSIIFTFSRSVPLGYIAHFFYDRRESFRATEGSACGCDRRKCLWVRPKEVPVGATEGSPSGHRRKWLCVCKVGKIE